jgi:hypothetical protein
MAMGCSWMLHSVVLLFCLFPFAISLPWISVVGSKSYDSDGNQFFIKGTVNIQASFQYLHTPHPAYGISVVARANRSQ